jgi:putative oxidoreductase
MTALDRIASRNADLVILVSRILMALLFVNDLYGKLGDLNRWFASRSLQVLPFPQAWALGGIILLVVGLIGLILGYKMRLGALALAVFSGFAAVLGHQFWVQADQWGAFLKDIALVGGYLALFVTGPGAHSMDAKRG